MSFYRFSQISGRLTPSSQLKAVAPQGLTPANKLKASPEIRANFPDMNRLRSTFTLAKTGKSAVQQSSRNGYASSSTSLPTEFTATGFPKFAPGTKIGTNMVMGKFGPYSPKIRALQQVFQGHPELPVYLKKGGADRMIHSLFLGLMAFQVFVLVPFSVYTLTFNPEPYKRLMGITNK